MSSTIWQLWMVLLRSWRWQTMLDCEILMPDNLSVTHWICLYSSEYKLTIHGLMPISPCLIVEVLTTWGKFIQPSGYNTLIYCAFTLYKTDVFDCFCDIIAQFLLVKHKLLNETMWHINLCSFQITYDAKKCTRCQYTNYHNTTNHSWYLPWLELLWSHDIHTTNKTCTKILQNFWVLFVSLVQKVCFGCTQPLWISQEPFVWPSCNLATIVGETEIFNFGMETSLGEGKLIIQTC